MYIVFAHIQTHSNSQLNPFRSAKNGEQQTYSPLSRMRYPSASAILTYYVQVPALICPFRDTKEVIQYCLCHWIWQHGMAWLRCNRYALGGHVCFVLSKGFRRIDTLAIVGIFPIYLSQTNNCYRDENTVIRVCIELNGLEWWVSYFMVIFIWLFSGCLWIL